MTLFRKPLVCYLGGSFLDIFETNKNNQERFSFSSTSIQHSEIVDEKKYSDELQKFIEELRLREGKGIILLSSGLVFANDINIAGKNEKDETEKFLTAVPLQRSNITTITLRNKNKLRIIAVNRKLFEKVLEVLQMNNIEVISVAPASVFPNRLDDQEFTLQEAKKIAGEKRILQRYNFLQSKDSLQTDKEEATDTEEPEEGDIEKKNMRKQYVLLAICIVILACAIGYFLLWSNIISNPWFKTSKSTQPKPTTEKVPSATSKPSPTAEPLIDKSSIKIEILNGSGIEGQAGKISSLLQEVGFSDVTTGNIDGFDQRTTITYKKTVSKDMLTEITDTIKDDFPDPTLQTASQSAEYDVQITTGQF